MKFENMNIEESILSSLNDIGFEQPTRIQSETIPIIKPCITPPISEILLKTIFIFG